MILGNNMSVQGLRELFDSIKHNVNVKSCLLELDKPFKN